MPLKIFLMCSYFLVFGLSFHFGEELGVQELKKAREAFEKNKYVDAIGWFEKAVQLGNVDAAYQLGFMYLTGAWFAENYEKAFYYLKKASEQGNIKATAFLASMYAEGKGVEKNISEAVLLYEKAANGGDEIATVNLIRAYSFEESLVRDDRKAFLWCKTGAENNILYAITALAESYRLGRGTPKNISEALKYYQLAIDKKDANAMLLLADMYYYGWDVTARPLEALRLANQALDLGSPEAARKIGEYYLNGQGIIRNLPEALSWLKTATEMGDVQAMVEFGKLYAEGNNELRKNPNKALSWYKKARENGAKDLDFTIKMLEAKIAFAPKSTMHFNPFEKNISKLFLQRPSNFLDHFIVQYSFLLTSPADRFLSLTEPSKKKKEHYERIEFLVGNSDMVYTSGSVIKFNTGEVEVVPTSDVRYVEGGQLYCSLSEAKVFQKTKSGKPGKMFNKDGSLIYELKKLKKDQTQLIVRRSNEEILGNFIYNPQGDQETLRLLYLKGNGWSGHATSHLNKMIKKNFWGEYRGYGIAGTITSQAFGKLHGYIFPIYDFAQGSVVYRETVLGGEWVLIVGDRIEMVVPARLQDKPNVETLENNLIVTDYNGPLMYQSELNKEQSKVNITRFLSYLGNYQSKGIESLNGYGVKFSSSEGNTPGKYVFFEVGIFKNGRLDGLGYRIRGDAFLSSSSYEGGAFDRYYHYYLEAGVFENGLLKNGRTKQCGQGAHNDNYMIKHTNNYLAKGPVEGMNYFDNTNNNLNMKVNTQLCNFRALKGSDRIYVKVLNRVLSVHGVDAINHSILVYNDQNKIVSLDADIGDVFLIAKGKASYKEPCAKYRKEPVYYTERVKATNVSYDTKFNRVNSVYGIYLTETKTRFETTRWAEKKGISYYAYKPCNFCEGKGYIEHMYNVDTAYKIDFGENL